MSDRGTVVSTRSMIAGAALVLWILVLFFGWAIRPIDDTVPVIVDPNSDLAALLAESPVEVPPDGPRAQLVECNSLLDGSARDESTALPGLPPDYVYARTPCDTAHGDAQLVAVVNVLAVIAGIAGWIWISRRTGDTPLPAEADALTV